MIGSESQPRSSLTQMRLHQLRQLMHEYQMDALLVRSTDEYLNEYVPTEQSRRAYITGFTGSLGDALITTHSATLFVDGRYALQAKDEARDFEVRVVRLGESIESAWLNELERFDTTRIKTIAIESDRIPVNLFQQIQLRASHYGFKIRILASSPIEEVRNKMGPTQTHLPAKIWSVSYELTGQTPLERLRAAREVYASEKLDAMLIVPLDEIAWLTDLRGDGFPYQATFPARALAFRNEIWVYLNAELIPLVPKHDQTIRFFPENEWKESLTQHLGNSFVRVGVDPDNTPEALRTEFETIGVNIVHITSPFSALKAKKTPQELLHMRSAFARADAAVYKTQRWVNKELTKKQKVSEADVDNKIRQEFVKSGARGLSFKPICAAGKNGAVIHYSHPDPQAYLRSGELFLLDTGALYEGGYATDLTRTFLVGDKKTRASELHKRVFTLVLKAAIAGMSARFPRGTTGIQLDSIVRDPIWRQGINFDHGTGHGVGINVHENPPRISTKSRSALEVGHVFSIEPGLYIPGFGGVRIENLCTLIEDPARPDFLCVLPLTFSPLDKRLIAKEMLTSYEKKFLLYYTSCARLPKNAFPPPPPQDEWVNAI